MELLQMKYFLAVAREESISRAADFLYITQPSLTRQIQSMEKEVGQPLFVRGGKKMRLTEAGLLLKKRAEEILALYEKTESELIHPQQSVSGNVYLGGGESHAMRLLLDIANEMRTQYPNIKLHIYSGACHPTRRSYKVRKHPPSCAGAMGTADEQEPSACA